MKKKHQLRLIELEESVLISQVMNYFYFLSNKVERPE
jgi:hypothetical protein